MLLRWRVESAAQGLSEAFFYFIRRLAGRGFLCFWAIGHNDL